MSDETADRALTDRPLALDAYEILAETYSAMADTKPHNAYYERPATLSLLPDVAGKRVLDAGCGPGIYAKWLSERGAQVVGIDASEKMLEQAKKRLGETNDKVKFHLADLGKPLSFLADNSFELVLSPLVLDCIKDWTSLFKEFARVLCVGGYFIFSAGHPFFDYNYFKSEHYFDTEQVECEWKGFTGLRVRMPSYRRSLSEFINPLIEAGFLLEQLLEPKPTAEFREADPKGYEKLMKFPGFLCVRARKL